MQQYIVRREQDFKRMEENSTGTQVIGLRADSGHDAIVFGRIGPEGANLLDEFLYEHVRVPENRPHYEDLVSKLGW